VRVPSAVPGPAPAGVVGAAGLAWGSEPAVPPAPAAVGAAAGATCGTAAGAGSRPALGSRRGCDRHRCNGRFRDGRHCRSRLCRRHRRRCSDRLGHRNGRRCGDGACLGNGLGGSRRDGERQGRQHQAHRTRTRRRFVFMTTPLKTPDIRSNLIGSDPNTAQNSRSSLNPRFRDFRSRLAPAVWRAASLIGGTISTARPRSAESLSSRPTAGRPSVV